MKGFSGSILSTVSIASTRIVIVILLPKSQLNLHQSLTWRLQSLSAIEPLDLPIPIRELKLGINDNNNDDNDDDDDDDDNDDKPLSIALMAEPEIVLMGNFTSKR